MMVLQIPYIAYALYVIYIVTNESPTVSLRTGIASLLSVAAVLAITLIVVIATDNDPMARVLGLAIITFLGGMITVATSIAAMGPIWGLICAVAIGFWRSCSGRRAGEGFPLVARGVRLRNWRNSGDWVRASITVSGG